MSAPDLPSTPHLILGGAKSGKSKWAEELITAFPPPYIYVATAQALDEEMKERIRIHRERRSSFWETLECPIRLTETLGNLQGRNLPVLVDCLTLWLSNLLLRFSPGVVESQITELRGFIGQVDYPLILVSNEVGAGIVPDNPMARRFRDLAGTANREFAGACASVTYVVAGLAWVLKGPNLTPPGIAGHSEKA
ncbi:MAG TPA: bifunctional adenosylcobinamide kinase/adenosylcobinamide-phosphate guanylyltransferase [Syntrophobacteraceae bacterium]|nr:bifunctional adenosylcobinamide kinase/adenosylcobinamide-phosphate guanylyltransferase [Syntrophobacteraceae bacterium]